MLQPEQTVAIEEFADRLDDVLAELQAGRTLKLTHDGQRIAEIVPRSPEPTHEQREAARKRLLAIMQEGIDLDGKPFTYNERHDR